MRFVFELRRRVGDGQTEVLVEAVEEDCHPDAVERRAKALLWTRALSERQDVVIVRRTAGGHEIYRRTIGTGYRAAFGQSR